MKIMEISLFVLVDQDTSSDTLRKIALDVKEYINQASVVQGVLVEAIEHILNIPKEWLK